MTDAFEWQGRVGDTWAAEWRRTDRSLAQVETALLDRLDLLDPAPAHVLDIGCGAGSTTIAAARRFPGATCLGIDLSEALVEAARARPAPANCRFECADASAWRDPGFRADTLITRHGVMFFDDPVAAFANLGEAAAPGARLVFSCFRAPAENEWATDLVALLPDAPRSDPDAPGPFAFADPERVARTLAAAGWEDARPERFDWRYVAGAGADAVADARDFFAQIGPAARAARSLAGSARADFLARLDDLLAARLVDGTVAFDAAGWIWTAQNTAT